MEQPICSLSPLAAVQFVRLDDSILRVVENWGSFGAGPLRHAIDEPPIRAAQSIIQRLRSRDLYRFVEEVVVPSERIINNRCASAKTAELDALPLSA